MVYFLNDRDFIKADVYAIFNRIMKLGIKQLYIDNQIKLTKKSPTEDNEIFYKSTIEVNKFSHFYIRCYRIFAILLKELDPSFYESLARKKMEPPMIFLYFLLIYGKKDVG